MKKTNKFEGILSFLAYLAMVFSFTFVEGRVRLMAFLAFGLVFTILSIYYAKEEDFTIFSNFIKFFLSFLNITSLVYFLEEYFKTSYFGNLLETIYGPFFEKNIDTNLFLAGIFLITSIILIGYSRLKMGEDYGEEK